MSKATSRKRTTVANVCSALEDIAPLGLAESWDNVGLLVGDRNAPVRRMLLCIDLTPAVAAEAVRAKADFVMSYHPPLFKPASALRKPSTGTDAVVFDCIRNGIAIYAPHTALDAAEGGTNDVLAALCGLKEIEPIKHVDQPGQNKMKLIVFVPAEQAEKVADAVFNAGAGQIGDYSRCSYRLTGQGTFFGGESTNPALGQRGKMEYVDEVRLETVVPEAALPAVVAAMIDAHPYEEPAYDIYRLTARPVAGAGRVGRLPRVTTTGRLARKLKRATGAPGVQIVGPADRGIERVIVAVGSAGDTPFRVALTAKDVIVTGEIRHHDALTIQRYGCTAIALSHWSSERPVLPVLADRLLGALPGVDIALSDADQEPFHPA